MALTTTQKFRVGLYGAFFLALAIAGIAYMNTTALFRRGSLVTHTGAVLLELEGLQSTLKDAETGQRGFLLTGDRRYLGPYETAVPMVEGHLRRLRTLVRDDSLQRRALDSLAPLVRVKLDELRRTVQLDTTTGTDRALAIVRSGEGKAAMDTIRDLAGGMEARERTRRALEIANQEGTAARSEKVLLLCLGLTGLLFLAGAKVIEHDDQHRTTTTLEMVRLRDEATAAAADAREQAERAEEEAAKSEEETARAEDEAARAEEYAVQAEEARERLEAVLAGISDGFLVVDRARTVLYVNEQGAQMLGATRETLLMRSLWEALPDWRDEALDRGLSEALARRDIVRLEAPVPGGGRWLAANVYPAGENLSIFVQDVTARHDAEALLRAGDERLRVALDAGRFGVWEWDIGTGRVEWSDRVYDLHGLAVGAFGGRLEDFAELVHPGDRARVDALIQGAIRDRQEYQAEFRTRHPDGTEHWIATRARTFYADDGTPLRMVGVSWERTEQRMAEEAARHAQRMEAIGRLAGGIAHEVNNQMSVVLGFAQFLSKRSDLPSDARADVAEIHRAGERSAAITSQLLAFSRRQVLRPEHLDLNEVILRFERVLRRTVGDRTAVRSALAPEIPAVEADRGQLEQVLLNLAMNAADAMPHGGTLMLETGTAQLPNDAGGLAAGVNVVPGRYVRLEVRDSGHGMDPEVLRHVFEPFFTTKPPGKGTGLGLSTVYGIVKQSGGYVWVDSARGEGTAVRIFFPASQVLASVAAPAAPLRPTPARGTVMVVEDEPAVRAMVARILEDEGYDVLATQHGQEALETLGARDGVRLVVSDVAMPVMGGRELGDRLSHSHPGLPVLYMSGFADDEIVARGLLEPGRPFIQKPFSPDLFAQRVAELLQQMRR